jgi:hypothetical protein
MTSAVVFALACITFAAADPTEKDEIQAKLEQAKDAYQKAVEKAKDELLQSLQKREDTAREDGNKKLVDQIKADREAFEASGQLPKVVPVTAYQRTLDQARLPMETAFKAAVKEYLKAKLDSEADRVEAELKEFQANRGIVRQENPKGKSPGFLQFASRGFVELEKTQNMIDLNGSFTVEVWVRFPKDTSKSQINLIAGDEAWKGMSTDFDVPHSSCGWVLRTLPPEGGRGALVQFNIADSDKDWIGIGGVPSKLFDGAWHHVAVAKTPETIRVFADGKQLAEKNCKGLKFVPCPSDLYLGVRKYGYENRRFEGDIRAFRVSNKARFVRAFQPQLTFGKDATTELLLDFASEEKDTILDLSGKNRHGRLFDVIWVPAVKSKN